MNLLLDSHVFVWLSTRPQRLESRVVEAVQAAGSVYVSPVTAYEIGYKRRRDAELARMPDDLDHAVHAQGLSWLTLTVAHMQAAAGLPDVHRDPWDASSSLRRAWSG